MVEALREIVEDSVLPTHLEAMADEVGVEIARTVRATARVRLLSFGVGSRGFILYTHDPSPLTMLPEQFRSRRLSYRRLRYFAAVQEVQHYISDNRRLLHSVYLLYAEPSEDGALITLDHFRCLPPFAGICSTYRLLFVQHLFSFASEVGENDETRVNTNGGTPMVRHRNGGRFLVRAASRR